MTRRCRHIDRARNCVLHATAECWDGYVFDQDGHCPHPYPKSKKDLSGWEECDHYEAVGK